jgi:enoyl-CoA hydratase
MSDYDLPGELTVTRDGAVRVVSLNRPGELNAVNRALHWGLANVWRQLAADTEARVVIITGAGRAFSAGGDLDWITSFLDDPVARDESLREGAQIIEEMLRFPLPVIAAVNGAAVGLGCSLAVLCDIVLISERAFLADPHVSVGLVAGDGGAAFWTPGTAYRRGWPPSSGWRHGWCRRMSCCRLPSPWRRGSRPSRRTRCAGPSEWPACTCRRR